MSNMEGVYINMTEYYLAWSYKYQHDRILFGMGLLKINMGEFYLEMIS